MGYLGQMTLSLLLFAPGVVLLCALAVAAVLVHRDRTRRAALALLAGRHVAVPPGPGRIVAELKQAIAAAAREAIGRKKA